MQVATRYARQRGDAVVYNSARMRLLRDEVAILRRLQTSLRDDTLEVWYQPIMNLHTGTFIAVEALLRLRDGQGRMLPTSQGRGDVVRSVGRQRVFPARRSTVYGDFAAW